MAFNNLEIVKLLIENRADVNVVNSGNTALHIATFLNNQEIAKLLIENGADLNVINKDGSTPLHMAVHKNKQELAKLFVENKADVNAKQDNSLTSLQIASIKGYQSIKSLLSQNGAERNFIDFDDLIAHQKSLLNNGLKYLKFLLENETFFQLNKLNDLFEPLNNFVNKQIASLFERMADYSVLDK